MEMGPELSMLIQIIDSEFVLLAPAPILRIILNREVVEEYEETAWAKQSKIDSALAQFEKRAFRFASDFPIEVSGTLHTLIVQKHADAPEREQDVR